MAVDFVIVYDAMTMPSIHELWSLAIESLFSATHTLSSIQHSNIFYKSNSWQFCSRLTLKKLTVMAIDHLPGVRSHNYTAPYWCDRLRHFNPNWVNVCSCIRVKFVARPSPHTNTTTSGYRWHHPTQHIDRFEWPNIFRIFAGRHDTIFPQTVSIQRFIMKYEAFDFQLKFKIHFRRIFVDEIAKNRKQ